MILISLDGSHVEKSSFVPGAFVLSVMMLFILAAVCLGDVVIRSNIAGGQWSDSTEIYPLKGQELILKVDRVDGACIRWYQIIPDISIQYKNANFPWEKDPYKWIGWASIRYDIKELVQFQNKWEVRPFKKSKPGLLEKVFEALGLSRFGCQRHGRCDGDPGSYWFQAEVVKDGRILRSSDVQPVMKGGLTGDVFRVSMRDGEGYLGYVASFYNVPAVFGSVPKQSNNYIGVDCADVLLAAYRRWRGKLEKKDYNVAMLVNALPRVASFNIKNGMPDKTVSWGTEIMPGDFIAVKFPGRKSYQHIGALHSDVNKNGIFDGGDLVLHAGPAPLHLSRFNSGSFDGHVQVLRPEGDL